MEQISLDEKENDQAAKSRFLKTQDIIGATVTGMSKNRNMIQGARCRILIVEEAAEILESQTLSAITPTVEHVILIGDHKQLPAVA